MIELNDSESAFFYYAKGWYARTNTIDDVLTIYGKYYLADNVKRVQIDCIISVLTDLCFKLGMFSSLHYTKKFMSDIEVMDKYGTDTNIPNSSDAWDYINYFQDKQNKKMVESYLSYISIVKVADTETGKTLILAKQIDSTVLPTTL